MVFIFTDFLSLLIAVQAQCWDGCVKEAYINFHSHCITGEYRDRHHHPHSVLHSSLAASQMSVGLTDQALLIYCCQKLSNYMACIKYYCFLH